MTLNCSINPSSLSKIFFEGETLATKEGSIKAVQRICQLLGVDFDEKILSWDALDPFEMDPRWVFPSLQIHRNKQVGFFSRANSSTHFEDAVERQTDVEQLKETRPDMAACIDECTLLYNKIINDDRAQVLVPMM